LHEPMQCEVCHRVRRFHQISCQAQSP
jgi:hypothetical protein